MAEKKDSGQAGMTTGRIARVPSFPLVGNPSLRHTMPPVTEWLLLSLSGAGFSSRDLFFSMSGQRQSSLFGCHSGSSGIFFLIEPLFKKDSRQAGMTVKKYNMHLMDFDVTLISNVL
jgi:hypothetical protein